MNSKLLELGAAKARAAASLQGRKQKSASEQMILPSKRQGKSRAEFRARLFRRLTKTKF